MDNYRKIEIKGKGSYGQAMLVQHKGDHASLFDLKQKENAINEVNMLKDLYHPCIIRYRESFVDRSRYLCIVMDYADEGTLEQKLQQCKQQGEYMSEELIVEWLAQMCLAVKYIHDRRIIHRDLKTQNIFIARNEIRLGDFGIARVLNNTDDLCQTAIGTPYFISPEVCQRIPYDMKSDIWSMGCILYEMMALRHAFDAKTMEGLFIKIMRGQYPPLPNQYSDKLKDLLAQMLVVDPNKRISVDELLKCDIIKRAAKKYFDRISLQPTKLQFLSGQEKRNRVFIEKEYQSEPKQQSESIADQIERMRMELEDELGVKGFLESYKLIKNNGDVGQVDDNIVRQITKLIGLEQLVF